MRSLLSSYVESYRDSTLERQTGPKRQKNSLLVERQIITLAVKFGGQLTYMYIAVSSTHAYVSSLPSPCDEQRICQEIIVFTSPIIMHHDYDLVDLT